MDEGEVTMPIELFAGVPVSDHAAGVSWFERLLGEPSSFQPHATESVWTLAEHRYVYVVLDPERAGHALVTFMVDDLEGFLAAAGDEGVEPVTVEEYENDVRKAVFRDPDGNEIGVGEVPEA